MKKTLGSKSLMYPMPIALVGTRVEGKTNFYPVAFLGIVNANPGMLAIGTNRKHYSNRGILEHKEFSVNLPHTGMLKVTDYAGLHSGQDLDKSKLFEVFYGRLKNAPLIQDCPLNLECRVVEVLDRGGMDLIVIGEIVESHCDEDKLTNGLPDIEKMQPILFSMYDNRYFSIGPALGPAWSIGKDYQPKR